MKKIKLFLLVIIATLGLNSCEDEVEAPGTNYITFGNSSYSTLVDPGSSTAFDIPVYTANIEQSDRSFLVTTDGSGAASGTYNVPSSVVIPSGTNKGTLTVELDDPGIAQNVISISFDAQAGLSISEPTSLTYTQSCTEITATLEFSFDYYSSETGWRILDSNGDTVISKAAGSYSDGQGSATESIQLCQGRNYTLVVTDAWGDGMNDGTNLGSYTLTISGVVKATGGGSFGASESTDFDTN